MKKISLLKLFTFSTVIGWLITSCIDEYDPQLTATENKLVVTGRITNQPGPYEINVSLGVAYNSTESVYDRVPPIESVWIEDKGGVSTKLSEKERGKYVTPANFRGRVGNAYRLSIKLTNGKLYQSPMDELKLPPAISSVYSVFNYDSTKQLADRANYSLYIDTQDPSNQANYYMWDFKNYQRISVCNRFNRSVGQAGQVIFEQPCCEKFCWQITTCEGCVNIASDELVNGRKLTKQPIGTMPYDSKKPYYLVAEQYHLTKEVYQFWKSFKEQTRNVGGIFDTTPATIRGNIVNASDRNDYAIGYFQVSGVSEKIVFFDRSNEKYEPYEIRKNSTGTTIIECQACLDKVNRTITQPIGWSSIFE